MAEKEEFEVVDKRRARPEAEGPSAEAGAAPDTEDAAAATEGAGEAPERTQAAASEAPGAEGAEAGEMPMEMNVYVLLSSMIGMLHNFAWQKMGFIANRETGETETDLPQAKVAIDTVQFLVGQLEPQLSDPEKRELRRVVMDLQMNYLRKSSRS